MRQLSKLFVRLNVETRGYHAQADAPWHKLLVDDRRLTPLDYVQHLVQRYGFDAPLEAALAYTTHLGSFVDLHRRFRAGMIAQDLLALGLSPATLAGLRQYMIAPFSSVADALGWLYVHQRSSLLHEAVVAKLTARLPEVAHATTYLRANEGHIGVAWQDLGQTLDRVARTATIADCIVAAAHDAFRAALAWQCRATPADARQTRTW